MKLELNDKEYSVRVAQTEDEKSRGLQGIENLPDNEGMLFVFPEPTTVSMWMKDTLIPLSIIFINEDQEVISIYNGLPNDETIAEEDNVKYVLEINADEDVNEGDEVDFDEDELESNTDMIVLDSEGKTQAVIKSGERIFSRKNTKTLIKLAKKADASESDSDYRKLGRKIFKYIAEQDSREPEYVSK